MAQATNRKLFYHGTLYRTGTPATTLPPELRQRAQQRGWLTEPPKPKRKVKRKTQPDTEPQTETDAG